MGFTEIISPFLGHFTGTNQLWLEPGKPTDEQPIALQGMQAHTPHFVRLTYTSTTHGKPMVGELVLGYDPMQNRLEAAWTDSFHMSKAMLHLVGEVRGPQLWLEGHYYAGPDHPRWGWHITLEAMPTGPLLQMYNVEPGGAPELAVQFNLKPA